MRLQEEADRAQRYGVRFSIVIVKAAGIHHESDVRQATGWSGERVRRHLRHTDVPACLSDGNLAVLLPGTGQRGVRELQKRIVAELSLVDPQIGAATFPKEADSPNALLELAYQRCAPPAAPPRTQAATPVAGARPELSNGANLEEAAENSLT
jgi:hypothetical protein